MQIYNIIFLDVDGVLNTMYSILAGPFMLLDNSTINNLRYILSMTDARIVLSTAWRLYPKHKKKLIEELEKYGIGRKIIIGETMDLSLLKKRREDEIKLWLRTNSYKVRKWVAIDDMNLKELSNKNFVKTSFNSGLTMDKAREVLQKLY